MNGNFCVVIVVHCSYNCDLLLWLLLLISAVSYRHRHRHRHIGSKSFSHRLIFLWSVWSLICTFIQSNRWLTDYQKRANLSEWNELIRKSNQIKYFIISFLVFNLLGRPKVSMSSCDWSNELKKVHDSTKSNNETQFQ